MHLTRRLMLSLVLISVALAGMAVAADDKPLSVIAFGSCAKQNQPQPIWDAVIGTRPELFLMIGDNIYGDTEDMAVLKAKYELLAGQPGYQMLKSVCPIWATWDDHDYGQNDAGIEYPKKRESQRVFLEHFEEPADSIRWKREGVYDAKVFGPAGKRVQVILLDTRYFRSPLVKKPFAAEPGEGIGGYYPAMSDPAAEMLGESQWRWLEKQLRVPAEVRIVASSIQLIANEDGWERWGTHPHERQRMFDLIEKTGANGVVFISGDRHQGEISRLNDAVGYPLHDVTSSSLNAPSKWRSELNRHRLGSIVHDENFGTITIDWSQPDPIVRLQVRNIKGAVVLQTRTTVAELMPSVGGQ